MCHYILSGYKSVHSTNYPVVKMYGIFDNLDNAIEKLSYYTLEDSITCDCEPAKYDNGIIRGNSYILWIQKVTNENLINNDGLSLNNGMRVPLKIRHMYANSELP